MPWNADKTQYIVTGGTTARGQPIAPHTYSAAEWNAMSGSQKQQADPMGGWDDDSGKSQSSGNPFDVTGGADQLAQSFGNDIQGVGTMLGLIPKRVDPNAAGASLDTSAADAERERMSQLLSGLQQQAATGSGAWEKTFHDATQKAGASAMALGQSMPGQGYASSLRNIGNAQGAVGQRAVGQESILRNQAQLDARGQLSQLLGGMGAQDINQADASSKVNQGVRELNSGLAQQSNSNVQDFAKGVGQAVAMGASDGGKVPGRPPVFGDDSRNDIVPAMLSPGEIVIPRSHASSPEAAADFVRALHASRGIQHFAGGGSTSGTGLTNTGSMMQDFGSEGEAPTVGNGGLLNTSPFNQTRDAHTALEQQLQQSAAGKGPSVAPQQLQSTYDENLAAALQARAGHGSVPAGDVVQATAAAQQGAAGVAGAGVAGEQSHGQQALMHALETQRARELAMANAQQQAAWRNTQLNAGLGLAQQAQLRGILSGAGQAGAAFASMDDSGPSSGNFSGSNRNLPSFDQGFGPGGSSSGSSPDEWAQPYAEGGKVANPDYGSKMKSASEQAEKENAEFVQRRWDEKRKAAQAAAFEENVRFSEHRARGYADGGVANLSVDDLKGATPAEIAAALSGAGGYGMPALPKAAQDAGVLPLQSELMRPPTSPGEPVGFSRGPSVHTPLPLGGPKAAIDEVDPLINPKGTFFNATPISQRIDAKPLPPGVRKPGEEPPATRPPEASVKLPVQASGQKSGPLPGMTEEQRGIDEERAAIEAKGRLEAEQAKATAGALAEGDKVLQQHELQQKELQARARAGAEGMMRRYEAAQTDLQNIDTTVDPGRFWATRSTAGKISGIIGLALGALGTGPDGVNRAAQMLQQAIDRDIDAQKAEHTMRLQKGRAAVDTAQTMFGLNQQIFDNDLAAEAATHATAWARVDNNLKRILASGAGPQAQAAAAQLSALVEQKKAKFTADAANTAFDNTTQRILANAQAGAKGNAIGGLSKEEQSKVLDVETATRNIKNNLTVARDIIRRKGTFELTGTEQSELERALADVAQDSARLKDPGSTVREAELANAKKAIGVSGGEIFSLRNGTALKLLDSYEKSIEQRQREALTVRGIRAP